MALLFDGLVSQQAPQSITLNSEAVPTDGGTDYPEVDDWPGSPSSTVDIVAAGASPLWPAENFLEFRLATADERAELRRSSDETDGPNGYAPGETVYYAWRWRMPDGHQQTGAFWLLAQAKNGSRNSAGGSPNLSLEAGGDDVLGLVVDGSTDSLFEPVAGTVYHTILGVRYATDGTGWAKVWNASGASPTMPPEGSPTAEGTGATAHSGSGDLDSYMRMGPYHSANGGPVDLDLGGWREYSTFAEAVAFLEGDPDTTIVITPADSAASVKSKIEGANNGDVIELQASTPGGSGTITADDTVNVYADNVTIRERDGDTITFAFTGGSTGNERRFLIQGDGCTVEASTKAGPADDGGLTFSGSHLRIDVQGDNCSLLGITMTNGGTNIGVSVGWSGYWPTPGPVSGFLADGCRVHDVGDDGGAGSPAHCFYFNLASSPVIRNCFMWNATHRGVQLFPYCVAGTFEHNVIAHVDQAQHAGNGNEGTGDLEPESNTFERNIVVDACAASTFYGWGGAPDDPPYDGAAGTIVDMLAWSHNFDDLEDLAWAFTLEGGATDVVTLSPVAGTHYVNADPQFTDSANGDFTPLGTAHEGYGPDSIQPGSPTPPPLTAVGTTFRAPWNVQVLPTAPPAESSLPEPPIPYKVGGPGEPETVSEAVRDSMIAMVWDDANQGNAFLNYVTAAARPFELANYSLQESEDGPAWTRAMRPDLAADEVLSWAAQFYGVAFEGRTPGEVRAAMVNLHSRQRGTVGRIEQVARLWMDPTDTDQFGIVERINGNPWQVGIVFDPAEVVDAVGFQREVTRIMPAGLIVFFTSWWSWINVPPNTVTWTQMPVDFTDWTDVATGA